MLRSLLKLVDEIPSPGLLIMPALEDLVIVGMDHLEYLCGKALSLIFLGFLPWGDTMLLCAMLDAHPKMQCFKETHIISHVLAMSQAWSKSSQEKLQLDEVGMTDEMLDVAMQAFNLEVIAKHGKPVGILCNKDPSTLKFSVNLLHLLPAGGAGQLGLHVLQGHLQHHHCQLQPWQLARLPHQVQPGRGGDVCPVHGGGQGQVPASVLRAGGAAPWCSL